MLIKQILQDEYRFLTFRTPGPGIREHPWIYLAFALGVTWLAGVGRYWDSTGATVWQSLGLSSVAYVFAFAGFLWLVAAPLAARHWHYRNVLLFVSMTAPPALLYAIPVERFFEPAMSLAVNSAFLAIVAFWRVALLLVFLRRVAGLGALAVLTIGLLPLAMIVDVLAWTDTALPVYQRMAGIDLPDGVSNAAGRTVVQWISGLSVALTPVLLAIYCTMALQARTLRLGDGCRGDAVRHGGRAP